MNNQIKIDAILSEKGATTPETRLKNWQRKLLDLTSRNRLLNLKDSKKTIRLLCSADKLKNKLAGGNAITVISKDKIENMEQAEQLLEGKNPTIVAEGEQEEINARLTELYRKARMDLQEGGSNTLYLALGILKWKQDDHSDENYRAPLILMPVKLERKLEKQKARPEITITQHENETVLNLTLLEKLRQDFEIDLGYLETELSKDEADVNIQEIWRIVNNTIDDKQGFEVTKEVILSTFSFAKYLMWKDLIAIEKLPEKPPLVSRLISGGTNDEYDNSPTFIQPEELDKKINPGELYMPLLADSSQIVAVDASAKKGDFILEGPPGTGKSQTIANIIAHNLMQGRRILFVSEKMAALEVVYKRLREHGLGNFCLELHSNKANKKGVLKQLRQSWESENPNRNASAWESATTRLKNLRDQTNKLVEALHTRGATGISPYRAMGRKVRYQHKHPLTLDWGDLENDIAQDQQGLDKLTQMAGALGTAYGNLDKNANIVFSSVKKRDWTPTWEKQFIAAAERLTKTIDRVLKTYSQLETCLRLPKQAETSRNYLEGLALIASTIPTAHLHSIKFCLDSEEEGILKNFTDAHQLLQSYWTHKSKLSDNYNDEHIKNAPLNEFQDAWDKAVAAQRIIKFIRCFLVKRNIKKYFAIKTINEPSKDLSILLEMRTIRQQMDAIATNLPQSTGWRGLETDAQNIEVRTATAKNLLKGIEKLAQGNATALNDIRNNIKPLYAKQEPLAPEMPLSKTANEYIAAWEAFNKAEQDYQEQIDSFEPLPDNIRTLKGQIEEIVQLRSNIRFWCFWQKHVNEANNNGLNTLVTALEDSKVGAADAKEAFTTAYHTWLSWHMIEKKDELCNFSSAEHEENIQNFRTTDQEIDELVSSEIQAKLRRNIPQSYAKKLPEGYKILNHEMRKITRHKPIRELVKKMGNTLTDLCPCLMMSPLSVAQFLSPEKTFDLVIFDEASQITVWDAIGAIARGNNVIIVGDTKQMPPTNFFQRAESDYEYDENEELPDQESILEEAAAISIQQHRLTGHYRSKHESLIAFSNYQYYGGELVTYPSSQTKKSMISFRKIEGKYQRGNGRVNVEEAKAVVAEVVHRIKYSPDTSVGVVTLNSEQQRLINNLLDDERRNNEEIEKLFNDENNTSPVFVKNLETVQGDERDIILISVGYGPDDTPGAQTMSMNFGPLNRQGGERRLNVAITRATTEVVIFASFEPSMMDLKRTKAKAVQDLRNYMEFAKRGPVALGEVIKSVGNYYDSDFERAVADQLSNRGWNVDTQVGISRFRIDLGIIHPNKPGKYLAGIECDGATYHSSPSARDRDRIRQSSLEKLGWKLVRIWSTDYFLNEKKVMDKVDEKLNQLLNEDTEDSPETATTPTE